MSAFAVAICPCCGASQATDRDGRVLVAESVTPAPELRALTLAEVRVLALLASGYSNKAAARQLGLSPRTVETHRLNMRRKTGAGDRRALVVLAHHLGLTVGAEARA